MKATRLFNFFRFFWPSALFPTALNSAPPTNPSGNLANPAFQSGAGYVSVTGRETQPGIRLPDEKPESGGCGNSVEIASSSSKRAMISSAPPINPAMVPPFPFVRPAEASGRTLQLRTHASP